MNTLLQRQLRKHLAHVDPNAPELKAFLSAVGAAYDELEQERDTVQRTLDIASEELTAANDRLRAEAATQLRQLTSFYEETLARQQGLTFRFRRDIAGRYVHTLFRGALAARVAEIPIHAEGRALEDVFGIEVAEDLRPHYDLSLIHI